MKITEKKKVWVILVSCSTMLMVFSMLEMSILSNSSELETLGLMESGVVNLQMKMKLGITIKVWRKNWTMSLEMMVHGGWDMKIGVLTTTKCTFARFSPHSGLNSQSKANGKATLLAVHIHQWLTEMKKKRTMSKTILMTDGLTILSSGWLFTREHKSSSVSCKKMRKSQRGLISQWTS